MMRVVPSFRELVCEAMPRPAAAFGSSLRIQNSIRPAAGSNSGPLASAELRKNFSSSPRVSDSKLSTFPASLRHGQEVAGTQEPWQRTVQKRGLSLVAMGQWFSHADGPRSSPSSLPANSFSGPVPSSSSSPSSQSNSYSGAGKGSAISSSSSLPPPIHPTSSVTLQSSSLSEAIKEYPYVILGGGVAAVSSRCWEMIQRACSNPISFLS